MNNQTILLVEDTAELSELYTDILCEKNYDVVVHKTGKDLLGALQTESFEPDLLILDVKLPDINGLDLLSHLKEKGFNAPVIMMTGHGTINMAVDAMQMGASDFLIKPFSPQKLIESISKALEQVGLSTKGDLAEFKNIQNQHHQKKSKKSLLLHEKTNPRSFESFIGTSKSMREVYTIIESAAKSNACVFITGESGTGKELGAQALHNLSPRSNKPFVALNCAAIPRELLETELFGHVKGAFTGSIANREGAVTQAQGGTLFLDEIAEMMPDMQTKLLRFLQDLRYQKIGGHKNEQADIRIICATNRDPIEEIKMGRLRRDLYYRLHVVPIHMPPLRERPSDIIDLAYYFLKLYGQEEGKDFKGFSKEAEDILVLLPWDGNVRELQNVIRGIAVLHYGQNVTKEMLPSWLIEKANRMASTAKTTQKNYEAEFLFERPDDTITPLWKVEQYAIEKAIHRCDGNIPRAAALLQVAPSTLYRKIQIWENN